MNLKLLIRIGTNTLIGLVLIYFWLKLVDLGATFEAIRRVNLLILIPGISLLVLANVFKSLRLKLLLSDFKISFKNLFYVNFLSQLLSFTIPIRAGEIAKSVYLSGEYKIPFAKTVIWIFLDRFLDFWVVLVMSLILLLSLQTSLPQTVVISLSSLITLFTLITLIILFTPGLFRSIVKFFSLFLIFNKLKKIFVQISEFIIECTSLLKKGNGEVILLFVYTILGTISEALVWYLLFKTLINNVDFLKTFLGSMLSALTYLIPAAPGYVGSAEAAGLAVFNLGLGFDRNIVSAVTVIYHALTLIYMLVFGLLSLYLLKFDLSLVWKKLKKNND